MKKAVVRSILVGASSLLVYSIVLLSVSTFTSVDVKNSQALWWTSMFCIGASFAMWNAWDSIFDVVAAIRTHRPPRIIAGGQWIFRSNVLQMIFCASMVLVGLLSTLQIGEPELRTAIITLGGLCLVSSQVWDRLDRERMKSIPYTSVAAEIGRASREMGHKVANQLVIGVSALELALNYPGLTESERELIIKGIENLADLKEDVQDLHQKIRELDPLYSPHNQELPTDSTPHQR